jgi:YidC/Oxa1 family membrane protein insertase
VSIWDYFSQPMINGLLLLYGYMGHNLALSIAIFTVALRLLIIPLTLPQQRSAKKMQEMQQSAEWKEIQKKYAKDREKLAQEQMRLYKEWGVSPLGGCLPLLIQFPIWIGLYQAISQLVSGNPLQLLHLAKSIYPFLPDLSRLIPVEPRFLWLNLGHPDPIYILPVLVAATTWYSQAMMTPPSTGGGDDQAAAMAQSMKWTMPLMFGFFALQFPAGLSLYFIISNLVSVAIQYFTTGELGLDIGIWDSITARLKKGAQPAQANDQEKGEQQNQHVRIRKSRKRRS